MDKLPKLVISSGFSVHSKKRAELAMNHEPITHKQSLPKGNQLGFAPIALVVLLLLGIAAGTLLI